MSMGAFFIYCIQNTVNSKRYIGSAMPIKTRWFGVTIRVLQRAAQMQKTHDRKSYRGYIWSYID